MLVAVMLPSVRMEPVPEILLEVELNTPFEVTFNTPLTVISPPVHESIAPLIVMLVVSIASAANVNSPPPTIKSDVVNLPPNHTSLACTKVKDQYESFCSFVLIQC